MPYATQSDIQMAAGGAERLVQLADWNNDGTPDADVIARAQDAADAVIDAYLRNRYEAGDLTAFKATPPRELRDLAAAESVFWLQTSRGMTSEEDREVRRTRIATLEQVRNGVLRFDTTVPSTSRSSIVDATGDVTRTKSKGWFW